MKLSALIATVGDENVECQFLSDCLDGNQKLSKRGTQVTFTTKAVSVMDLIDPASAKIGIVVWLPRDAVNKARAAEQHLRPTTGAAA